jgi:hypothetical protein
MTITYTPVLSDLLHAARAWEGKRWKTLNRAVAFVLLAYGGFLVYLGWYWWSAAFLTFGLLEWFNLLPAAAIRAIIEFRMNPKFREEYQLTFTDEHLHFHTATIDSTLKWTHYNNFFETPKAFILVYGKGMYTVIPKRAINEPGEVDDLRNLLNRVIS